MGLGCLMGCFHVGFQKVDRLLGLGTLDAFAMATH